MNELEIFDIQKTFLVDIIFVYTRIFIDLEKLESFVKTIVCFKIKTSRGERLDRFFLLK